MIAPAPREVHVEEKKANTGAQRALSDLNKKLEAARQADDTREEMRLTMEKQKILDKAQGKRDEMRREHQKYLDSKGRDR